MKTNEILIRCSNIYPIMQNDKGNFFSEGNQRRIDELLSRTKPLTLKMEMELDSLYEKKEKCRDVKLSETCKSYLRSLYLNNRYGARYSFLGGEGVPQMVRGIKQEDWAVKMFSEFRGKQYYRNKKKLTNKYLTGSIDIFDSPKLELATSVIEIKTKETVGEFNKRIGVPLEDSHWLQIQGYLDLANKDFGEVVYCLVPPTEDKILEQKELYLALKDKRRSWEEIEDNIRFNDIPLREKIITYQIERDEKCISEIQERVEVCRKWIADFEKYHLDWINSNK